MEEMKAEVTAFRPIFRLLCCRRGLRKIFRGLRPRNLTQKKLSRAVKNLPPYIRSGEAKKDQKWAMTWAAHPMPFAPSNVSVCHITRTKNTRYRIAIDHLT